MSKQFSNSSAVVWWQCCQASPTRREKRIHPALCCVKVPRCSCMLANNLNTSKDCSVALTEVQFLLSVFSKELPESKSNAFKVVDSRVAFICWTCHIIWWWLFHLVASLEIYGALVTLECVLMLLLAFQPLVAFNGTNTLPSSAI